MTEQPTRTLAALAQANNLQLAPTEMTEEEMKDLDKNRTDLTVLSVQSDEVEGIGTKYAYTFHTGDGQPHMFSLWANIQRDATAIALMQLCMDGPVSGVRLVNQGTDKKPFWLIVPA